MLYKNIFDVIKKLQLFNLMIFLRFWKINWTILKSTLWRVLTKFIKSIIFNFKTSDDYVFFILLCLLIIYWKYFIFGIFLFVEYTNYTKLPNPLPEDCWAQPESMRWEDSTTSMFLMFLSLKVYLIVLYNFCLYRTPQLHSIEKTINVNLEGIHLINRLFFLCFNPLSIYVSILF